MSILLIGNFSDAQYAIWRSHLLLHLPQNESLVVATQEHDKSAVEIALVANAPVGPLSHLPNLRFVQSLWSGVERLLSDATLPSNIPIARLVDPAMAQTMVECAIAHVLYLHRQVPAYLKQQSDRTWRQLPQPAASSRPIGVLGLGQMGYAVARALARLGFPVMGWSLNPRNHSDIECHWGAQGLAKLSATAQILINLLPLTPRTAGILNEDLFEQLPIGAAIVNLGRGGHLVEQHLLAALARHRLSHAVLDVFNEEPLPADHAFWTHPKITVFPHVAAHTDPGTAARIVCENIAAFRAGREVTGLVSLSAGY